MKRSFAPAETGRGTEGHGDKPGVPIRAGGVHDPRPLPPLNEGRAAEPTAAVLSGRRAGYDGPKCKKGPRSSRCTRGTASSVTCANGSSTTRSRPSSVGDPIEKVLARK